MRRIIFLLLMPLFASLGSFAQSNYDLDFDTNLATPALPKGNVANAVRQHMKNIKNAVTKHGMDAMMDRNDEVVKVTIACADLFAPNDTVVTTYGEGPLKLRLLYDLLRYPTMYKMVVAVYNDDTGDELYAENLTNARANALYDFLLEVSGGEEVNVVPYGIGADDFLVENNSIANRSRNRRVEIYIIPEKDMIETAKVGKLK